MKLMSLDIETRDLTARYDPECPVWYVGMYDGSDYHIFESVEEARHMLEDDDTHFVLCNASFDIAVLAVRGVHVQSYDDVMLMSYVTAPSQSGDHSLNELGLKYLDKGKDPSPSFACRSVEMYDYLKTDLRVTYALFPIVKRRLYQDALASEYYEDIELPYQQLIMEMQCNGVAIDRAAWGDAHDEYTRLVEQHATEFRAYSGYRRGKLVSYNTAVVCGSKFTTTDGQGTYSHCELDWLNPNSGVDKLATIARHYPEVELSKTTKSGATAIDKYVLEKIAAACPAAQVMLRYNKASTLVSNFLAPIEELTRDTPLLRCNFNQATTRTTRLSSSNTNLQNMPSRDERGNIIRRMFVPDDNEHLMVVGDLDRIEVCVFAFYLEWMLGYTKLADAVRNKVDVHQVNSDLWGCERYVAKTGIFLLIYGGGAEKLAVSVGLKLPEAKRIFKRINNEMPIEAYREAMVRAARDNDGVLHGLLGQRFVIPEVLSSIRAVRAGGERKCGNYPIQGSAGAIFKFLQLKARPMVVKYDAKLRVVVHDEAVYTAHRDYAEGFASAMTNEFTDDTLLNMDGVVVPVTAAFHTGINWKEAKGA